MIVFEYFNTTLGSCLIIILIALDYLRKYNTDNFQRKLLILVLSSIFIAAIFDFLGLTLERDYKAISKLFGLTETADENINPALYYIWSIYLIARNCCYYYGAVFIDYFAHGNAARTKRFFKIVTVFLILYTISAVPNIKYGYYFFLSIENIYRMGPLYPVQLLISYLPIFLILIDISLAPKHIKRTQVLLTIFFAILTALGAAIDIILRTTNLIWPCVTGAILYIYFFIIRSNSKIDSLTGIGNRNSFYDHVNMILRQSVNKDYAFIKLDLAHFSEINDSFGHLEGDNALRDIAAIIKGCIRQTDFAARFGGDEFIVITTADSDIQRIIDRINEAINVQNNKNIRPYKIHINYGHNIYKANCGWKLQDFLSELESSIQKAKSVSS